MALTEPQIADLITAVLAVNLYPLERAAALMPAFKERGLLDPERVLAMKGDALVHAINDAGYRRGGYVNVIAFRLDPIMEAVRSGKLDGLQAAADQGDQSGFIATLASVYGFGPRTAETAWMLWTGGGSEAG